ncbi:hypothetical protein KAI78_10165 [bacterium]|nr:hypothetical protein [bacterium]
MSGRSGFSYIFILLALVFFSLSFILINNITNTKRAVMRKNIKIIEDKNKAHSSISRMLKKFYEGEKIDDLNFLPGGNLHIINDKGDRHLVFSRYPFQYAIVSGNDVKPLNIGNDTHISGGVASPLSVYEGKSDADVDSCHRWTADDLFEGVDERFIEMLLSLFHGKRESKDVILHTVAKTYSSEKESIIISGEEYYCEGARFSKNNEISNALIISDKDIYFSENTLVRDSCIVAPRIFFLKQSRAVNTEIVCFEQFEASDESHLTRTNILGISRKHKNKFGSCSITLRDNASFMGNILLLPETIKSFDSPGLLHFKKYKDAAFSGKVVNLGVSQIKGNMKGSIYSRDFESMGVEQTLSGVTVCRSIEPDDFFMLGIAEGVIDVF